MQKCSNFPKVGKIKIRYICSDFSEFYLEIPQKPESAPILGVNADFRVKMTLELGKSPIFGGFPFKVGKLPKHL